MSSTIQHEDEQTQTLEDELHELVGQEQALERRTGSLELAGWLTVIFSLIAVALAIGAMIVAVSNKGSGSERIVRESVSSAGGGATPGVTMGSSANGGTMMGSSSTSHNAMMGVGGHGSFTSAQVAAAKHGTVYVQLGDYWAAPTVPSVKGGKVTFVAKNVGRVPHELMVERSPIKFDAPMKPNEDAAQGMIADMSAGQSGRMTVKLSPGTYVLFCNAPGHYELGQHITFKVTKS